MAELVDAPDLGSGGPKGPCGFESHLGHQTKRIDMPVTTKELDFAAGTYQRDALWGNRRAWTSYHEYVTKLHKKIEELEERIQKLETGDESLLFEDNEHAEFSL